ncbi:MAG: methyltransferase domain-containing protein, partial [Candidatus Hodarchaeota archaeon]
MINKNSRLHLGCATTYYPDYVNIDFAEDSVADLICDARNLPYRANSVAKIVAHHLIEHFDYVNCKYLLSEWFRVLKPKGRLFLETPDLTKSVKKFSSGDINTKITSLNWIFGIDQEGLQHKTGFSVKLLRHLLTEIGFDDIRAKKSRTHQYEPGIRIECSKSQSYLKSQILAIIQIRVRNELPILETSHLTYLDSEIFNKLPLLKLDRNDTTNKDKIYRFIA